MSSGRYQLLVKGTEDSYLTGTPKITYFKSMYTKVKQFLFRYNENPFYSYGSAYGGSQVCKINVFGDISRNNFLKITLPSLFVPTYGWCFPISSTEFLPTLYLLDDSYTVSQQASVKNTVVYYNTVIQSWLPKNISYASSSNKFQFSFSERYFGFKTLDEALFWGFKNYIAYKNGFYIFNNSGVSDLTLVDAGWVNSFSKYFRKYIDAVGSKIVDRIEFYIGGQLIENIPGRYLILYKDLTVPEQLQDSLNKLEGWKSTPSTSDTVYYVWIPVSLTNIPLCSLYRQDVEFRVFFKNFTDLIDPQYLNIDTQFKTIQQLPFTANSVVYNGKTQFFINENTIFSNTTTYNLDETVVPRASVLVGSNVFLLGSSNLIVYNPTSNAVSKTSFINSHTIKKSVGIVFSNNLYNFTGNGIVQKIIGNSIYEYKLNCTIKSVNLYNGLLYFFNGSVVYIYSLDLNLVNTLTFNSNVLFSCASSTDVYFVTAGSLYTNGTFTKILPTGTVVDAVFNTRLFICFTDYILYDDGSTLSRYGVSGITSFQVYKDTTNFVFYITTSNRKGVWYILEGDDNTYEAFSSLNLFSKGFVTQTAGYGVWVGPGQVINNNLNGQVHQVTVSGLSSNVSFAFSGTTFYIVDGTVIYSGSTNDNSLGQMSFVPLPQMQPITMSYDGQKIYIPPSNGTSNIVIYDTTLPLNQNESFQTIQTTGSLYTLSSYYDGKNIYMLPSSSDSNILTYDTRTNFYTFTDFVKTTNNNYTVQNLTATVSIDNILYMFYSNGFYRFDTSVQGNNLYPFENSANVFASIYDPINSNVYYFSSNLANDGLLFNSTKQFLPSPSSNIKIYNSTIGNVYSSMSISGSYLYLVPKIGTSILKILKTNPYDVTPIQMAFENGSNCSMVANSNLYCFPGPSSTNLVIVNTFTNSVSNITMAIGDYKTACYDGTFTYIFTTNTITRFNMSGDQFIDISGYSNLSANTLIKPTDYTVSNAANVFFVGSNILKYDTTNNTYSFTLLSYGNIVGVSEYINSNIYMLTNTGNIMFTNVITVSTNTNGTPVDICANSQYIFTLYKNSNIIGRLDLNGDINGTGYYSTLGTTNCIGNVINMFAFSGNIYTVNDNSNLAVFSISSGSFSNVQLNTKNSYPNFTLYGSSAYLLPQNGNVMIEIPSFTNTLLPISNISGASSSPYNFLYLASNTTNTIVQLDSKGRSLTFSTASNNSSCNYFNSNVFFFPYDSNVVSVYNINTLNFTNLKDTFNQSTMYFSNVIATYASYCLTDEFRLFYLNQTAPSMKPVSLYVKSYLLTSQKVNVPIGTHDYYSIFFDVTGTWTFNFIGNTDMAIYRLNSPAVRITQTNNTFTVTKPGFLNVFINKLNSFTILKPGDGFTYDDNIFYPKDTYEKSSPIPTITSQGYICSNSAVSTYSLLTNSTLFYNIDYPNQYNFKNVYSTPSCTYFYSDANKTLGGDNLVVYKNGYNYGSTPLYRFGTDFSSINSIIHAGLPGSTIIYVIADSTLWRFDELFDSNKVAQRYRDFTRILSQIPSDSIMFSLNDGIGVITHTGMYGISVQTNWTYSFSSPPRTFYSPINTGKNLHLFSNTGQIWTSNNIVSQASDIQNIDFTVTQIPSFTSFKNAVYDTNKYIVISTAGNVLAFNTTTQSISMNSNISFEPSVGSVFLDFGTSSFVPSSNSNDLVILYSLNKGTGYSFYNYNVPSILPKSVKYLSNVAYMLGQKQIVSFDMNTFKFGYKPTLSNTYLFEQGYVIYASNIDGQYNYQNPSSNVSSTSYDGRYINIVTGGSKTAQFDTLSNTFLYQPISSNSTIRVDSNVYFYTSNNFMKKYSFDPRSYVTTGIPEACDGLAFYGSNIFFSSNTKIYKMNVISLSNSIIYSNNFSGVGKTTKYGNQIAFTYKSNIVIINGDTLSNTTVKVSDFKNVIFSSSNTFYLTGNSLTRYSNGILTNYQPQVTTGCGFVDSGGNVFALSNLFLKYTPSSIPFYTVNLPYTTNVVTNYVKASNVYLPPGQNTNLLQVYDMSKSFLSSNSYSNVKIQTTNVVSYVITSDNVYYVSNTSGNLISYNGGVSKYYVPGSKTASFTGDAIYLSNSKLFFTTVVPTTAFKNNISFTQQNNINSLLLDGNSIYTIGDKVYKINYNNIQLYDTTKIFQPSSNNTFLNSYINSAYFDGRYLNFVTNTVSSYDTLIIMYPEILSPSIITEYVYLDDDERNKFINSDLKYIITQLQKADITSNGLYSINFLNLLTELIFDGDISRVTMYLNGQERFSCDADYMKNIQPYLYHTRKPTQSNVYMYSFSTNPEGEVPEGYLNASRIRDKVFDFEINSNVTVYGVTKNILTIRDGLGGLVFNNSTE